MENQEAAPRRDPSPEVTITFKGRGTIPFRYEEEYLTYIWCIVEREKKKEEEAAARKQASDNLRPGSTVEDTTANDTAPVTEPASPIDRVPSSVASLEEDLPCPAVPESLVCNVTTAEESSVTLTTADMTRRGLPPPDRPSNALDQLQKKTTQKPRRSMRHVIPPESVGPRRSRRLNSARGKRKV